MERQRRNTAAWLLPAIGAIAALGYALDLLSSAAATGLVTGSCIGFGCAALLRRGKPAPPAAEPVDEDEDDKSRARLDAVMASVTEGVLIVDREGVVLAASPVATSLLRLSWHAERHPRLATLLPWPQLELAVQACLADGQPQRFEEIGRAHV